jgi:serralysin
MDLAPGETAAISIYYSLSDGQASSDASLTITVQGVTEPGDDITGTRKDDTLKGTSEGERIFGRVGDDRIDGRAGEDTLFGEGGDLLVFADNFGKDVVTDFDSAGKNRDVIELSDVAAITGYNDLMKHHVHDTGRNTVIDVGNDRITLQGIDLRDLGRDDFVF